MRESKLIKFLNLFQKQSNANDLEPFDVLENHITINYCLPLRLIEGDF